jgi:predicted RNA binding protein YcfA (HicA-like mRNA interferase family)
MVKKRKLYQRILNSQKNVNFNQFISVVEAFGFVLDRLKGSHHTYKHPSVKAAFLLLQADKNGGAKPYQIKQFLSLVEEYNLRLDEPTAEGEAGDDE